MPRGFWPNLSVAVTLSEAVSISETLAYPSLRT